MKKYTTTQQNYVSEGLNQDTQLRTHIRKMLGFEPGNVYNCINGIRKSTGGYTWKRA